METGHRLALAIGISLLVIFSSFALVALFAHGAEVNIAGWQKAKEINLNIEYTKTNVYTGYYNRVILHFQLINATGKDDLPNMTFCTPSPNFPRDIRFSLDKNASTGFLPQFIEYYEDDNGTRLYSSMRVNVYVRVPPSTTKLYVFYDNPDAQIYNTPTKVFDFFDDFNYTNSTNLYEYYSKIGLLGLTFGHSQLHAKEDSTNENTNGEEYDLYESKTGLNGDLKNVSYTVVGVMKGVTKKAVYGLITDNDSCYGVALDSGTFYYTNGPSSGAVSSTTLTSVASNYEYFVGMTVQYGHLHFILHNRQNTAIYSGSVNANIDSNTWYPAFGVIFKYRVYEAYFYYYGVYVNQNNNITIQSVDPYTPHLPTDTAGGGLGFSQNSGLLEKAWAFITQHILTIVFAALALISLLRRNYKALLLFAALAALSYFYLDSYIATLLAGGG